MNLTSIYFLIKSYCVCCVVLGVGSVEIKTEADSNDISESKSYFYVV